MLKEIYTILENVRNTSSTNQKELILKNNKDNENLKTVLELTYNPHKKFGITEKILKGLIEETEFIKDEDFNKENVFEIYNKLTNSNINNKLRSEFVNFLLHFDEVEQDVLKGIVCKDLKLGVGKTIINRVWENLISTSETGLEIKPMLAGKFDINKPPAGEFVATEKLDGIRCLAILTENKIELYSRQGKLIEGCKDIELELLELRNKINEDIVLDGELLAIGCGYDTVYKETTKRVKNKNKIKTDISYVAFDILPYDEFLEKKCSLVYIERFEKLKEVFECGEFKFIEKIKPLYKGNELEKLMQISNEYKKIGAEGLMINLTNGKYEYKRSKNILKVKSMLDMDLRVVSYEVGTGRNKNRLGALIVEFEHEGKIHECKVGSGFSDSQRNEFWNNRELMLGKIIKVQYFEITNNQAGGYSLRFPVFVEICDKDEPSQF